MTIRLASFASFPGSLRSRVAAALRESPLALPAGFLALLWLQLFLSLTPSWSLGTYYDYGWFVPFAAGWLFWRRMARFQSQAGRGPDPNRASAADGWLFCLLAGTSGLLFLIRVVDRYDPYWRLPRLIHAAVIGTVHHLVLARFLGWKNSLRFIPITMLCLTAVPMPGDWEMALIEAATRKLMTVSAPACHLFGLPVGLSGSALSLNGDVLQIDEGCSGIRSLQSLLMLAVFAGEFFRTAWIARIGLIGLGMAYAFLFNAVRVVFLSNVFFRYGADTFHASHDFAGMVTFSLSALALFGSARLLKSLESVWARGGSSEATNGSS